MVTEISKANNQYFTKKGDTLFSIAQRFETTVELLKEANNLEDDIIKPNQRLRIYEWTTSRHQAEENFFSLMETLGFQTFPLAPETEP